MGIIGDIKNNHEQKVKQQAIAEENRRTDGAKQYIADENLKCESDMDFDTLKTVFDAFDSNQKVWSSMSFNMDSKSGYIDSSDIQKADTNSFNFAKALIYQNFMLMRKVDALSARLDEISKRLE